MIVGITETDEGRIIGKIRWIDLWRAEHNMKKKQMLRRAITLVPVMSGAPFYKNYSKLIVEWHEVTIKVAPLGAVIRSFGEVGK